MSEIPEQGWVRLQMAALEEMRQKLALQQNLREFVCAAYKRYHERLQTTDVEHDVLAQTYLLLLQMEKNVAEMELAVNAGDDRRAIRNMEEALRVIPRMADQYKRLPHRTPDGWPDTGSRQEGSGGGC